MTTNVLLTSLLGGIAGAIATIVAVMFRNKQARREMIWKSIVEAAIYDHSCYVTMLKETGQPGRVPPVVTYIYYYTDVLGHVLEDNLTAEAIEQLKEKHRQIGESFSMMKRE